MEATPVAEAVSTAEQVANLHSLFAARQSASLTSAEYDPCGNKLARSESSFVRSIYRGLTIVMGGFSVGMVIAKRLDFEEVVFVEARCIIS